MATRSWVTNFLNSSLTTLSNANVNALNTYASNNATAYAYYFNASGGYNNIGVGTFNTNLYLTNFSLLLSSNITSNGQSLTNALAGQYNIQHSGAFNIPAQSTNRWFEVRIFTNNVLYTYSGVQSFTNQTILPFHIASQVRLETNSTIKFSAAELTGPLGPLTNIASFYTVISVNRVSP